MNAGFTAADRAAAEYGKSAGDQWSAANTLYMKGQDADAARESGIIGSAVGLAGMAGYKGISNYGKTGEWWNSNTSGPSNFSKGVSKIGSNLGWGT
jgi:hypothetical protein